MLQRRRRGVQVGVDRTAAETWRDADSAAASAVEAVVKASTTALPAAAAAGSSIRATLLPGPWPAGRSREP